jgi:hypothetical protein
VAVVCVLGVAAVVNLVDVPSGRQVRVPAMELIETIALVCLVVVLGPAIRRFGRGYAHDLWRTTPEMPTALLRLLDVAYLLVFGGYILLTVSFDFGSSTIGVAQQVGDLCWRVGGLVLTMGLMHAATIMTLPIVALVSNSTRVDRRLPRWLTVALVVVGGLLALVSLWMIVGLSVAGIR